MSERNFSFKDTVLLEWGDTIIDRLKIDLEEFASFDSKLNAAFITDFEQKISLAYKEGGDNINLAQLQQKTEIVDIAMQDCRTYFKRLKYWVLDAFPDKKAIQKQFGIGKFRNISGNQAKMIQYMEGITDTINEHRTTLETVGAPADLLNQSSALSLALRTANKEQEQKKGTRTVDTEERIDQLNELYAILQKINAAADNIFEDLPAKRNLYRKPITRNGTSVMIEEEEEE